MKVFELTLHRILWNWLATNPLSEKSDWPEWTYNGGSIEEILSDCFACGYADIECAKCPLVWPEVRCCHSNKTYIFTQWDNSSDLKERSKLALIIANLPVKSNVEWE